MKVLVVDGDATLREGAVRAFAAAGHDALAASDGLEAWKQVRDKDFDALFVAWDLAHLDGLALVSLWQHVPHLRGKPIIMLVDSGQLPQARVWTQLTAGQAPEWDVLTKPCPPLLMVDVLAAAVSLTIRRSRGGIWWWAATGSL